MVTARGAGCAGCVCGDISQCIHGVADEFKNGAEHGEAGGDDGDVGLDGGPDGGVGVVPGDVHLG